MLTPDSHQRIRYLTLLSLLCALCITLRLIKLPIPNVQPVTDILMITTLSLGAPAGLLLATLTMLLSNLILGFGIWTLPQISAYVLCIFTVILCQHLLPLKRWFGLQIILALFLGFEYGFFVSLGLASLGSTPAFWGYYLSGLPFDTFHSLGNLIFYPLLYPPLTKAFTRYAQHQK